MARWEPDACGRLTKAAIELFQEAGYERTTVQEIAARAGLTERTFFRYFADKREVLFSGAKELEKLIVDRIADAPTHASPLDAIVGALEEAAAELEKQRDIHFVRARHALVTKHSELQERELIKLAALAMACTKALHARGVTEPSASLAAEAGMAVFKIGFERWLEDRRPRDFPGHIRAALEALKGITAQTQPRRARPKKNA